MYSTATSGGSEIVRAGYLTKSPPEDAPSISQWRRRWFVLRDSLRSYPLAERYVRLEYYQNEGEARKLADPKGIINLTECYRVSGCAPVKGHKFVFDVCTKERKYHLAAETPSEKHEWIQVLNEVLFATTIAPPQVKTQDLEDAEFQIQRRKSQSRTALKQVSIEGFSMHPRPQSFYEAPVETRKNRPLPPTPFREGIPPPTSTSPMTGRASPVPKPRQKLDVQRSLPVGFHGSNGNLAHNENYTAGSPVLPRSHHPFPPPPPAKSPPSTEYDLLSRTHHNAPLPPPPYSGSSVATRSPQLPPASDYEVPIQSMNKQPISHGRNSISAPVLQPNYEELGPPLPPPRRKGGSNTEHLQSLPNISADYDMIALPPDDKQKDQEENEEEEEDTYGHLIQIQTSYEPRIRHSDPAIIPLNQSSHLPPPVPSHGSGTSSVEGRRYYENTGFVPIKEETYTKLSHFH